MITFEQQQSDRTRYELNLNELPRDRRIAVWIDWQIRQGRNVAEMMKNIVDEVITGKSSLTGNQLTYQGDVKPIRPENPDDPVAMALLSNDD